jgi:hypothetical protein
MKMSVDHARKYHKAASRNLFRSRTSHARSKDRRDATVLDGNVAFGKATRGKDNVSFADNQIATHHRLTPYGD